MSNNPVRRIARTKRNKAPGRGATIPGVALNIEKGPLKNPGMSGPVSLRSNYSRFPIIKVDREKRGYTADYVF
jgi:hypothetical protein